MDKSTTSMPIRLLRILPGSDERPVPMDNVVQSTAGFLTALEGLDLAGAVESRVTVEAMLWRRSLLGDCVVRAAGERATGGKLLLPPFSTTAEAVHGGSVAG